MQNETPANGHPRNTLRAGLLKLLPAFHGAGISAPSHQPVIDVHKKVSGLVPELHLVTPVGPLFGIITNDGVRRSFLCLGVPPQCPMIAVHYTPDFEESADIFALVPPRGAEREQRRPFLGHAVLMSTRREGVQDNIYLTPADEAFKAFPWESVAKAPFYEVVYLLDAHKRMAIGYVNNDGAAQILSGAPGDYHPVEFHYAKATRLKKGAAAS